MFEHSTQAKRGGASNEKLRLKGATKPDKIPNLRVLKDTRSTYDGLNLRKFVLNCEALSDSN